MPILPPARYALAGTAKPVLVAALVAGAGVTAFATPLTNAAADARIGHPATVRLQFAELAVRSEPAPTNDAGSKSDAERSPPASDFAVAKAIPAAEPGLLPGVAPIDFVLDGRIETAAIAASVVSPAQDARPHPGYMPAAELKAMMAGVAASRGDLEERARPEVAITIAQADQPSTGETADQDSPGIAFEAPALVNGVPAGRVPLRIAEGENISIKLGDILAALQPLMDEATYRTLASSQAAGEYVTFDRLRASGIAVRFDAQDRVLFGSS